MFAPLIRTIVSAYSSPVIKVYIYLRFKIINRTILEAMLNYLRPDGRLCVMGCGFGLFDLLIGLKWPEKEILGFDNNPQRIETAKETAEKLGLVNNRFEVRDLEKENADFDDFDQMLLLDVLHHINRSEHQRLLRQCYAGLNPGGYLIVKDIHTANPLKLFFTWVLDLLMTKGEKVFYRSEQEVLELLSEVGFDRVIRLRLDDILPYPHILYVAIKGS